MFTDDQRFKWILDGNGYFLEEEALCGNHGFVSDAEKQQARDAIDEAMILDGLTPDSIEVDQRAK
jgi:hypothetical protein